MYILVMSKLFNDVVRNIIPGHRGSCERKSIDSNREEVASRAHTENLWDKSLDKILVNELTFIHEQWSKTSSLID